MSKAFTLVREQNIPELNSIAKLYIHKRTGARLLSIINDDENKVFSVNFRTTPRDSTGVAHILEHSVLDGSEKYPVKAPFTELRKGSLATFVNAFTFPDKTCYPVASQNLQDFYNLIDVYMDAVLHPLIGKQVLMQEGWHYEINDPGDPLIYKGVVFNEMKGVYSSPDSVLDTRVIESLFPKHIYGIDSGGDPRDIPNLTYENFKNFWETYYHPSNSYIYFYGNDDPEKRLTLMQGYLKPYKKKKVKSVVPLAKPFKRPKKVEYAYDAGDDKDIDKKHYLVVNWKLPDTSDAVLNFSFRILGHILIGTPASPLKKALLDSGLGEDLAGIGMETELRHLIFSTGLKGTRKRHAKKIEKLIFNTLETLIREGIDPNTVAASMNTIEFRLRENNTGAYPVGIALMRRVLTTWIHDEDPFKLLAFESPLFEIKSRLAADEHYFEKLIQAHLLDNPHRTVLRLKPDPELGRRVEEDEKARLEKIRASLSESQIVELVETTKKLKIKQETPDSPEALESLPVLKLEDLEKKSRTIPIEILEMQDTKVLYHELFTNGVIYLDLGFDLHALPKELLPLTEVFARALLEMGTETEDYVRLSQRIGKGTGGISSRAVTATTLGSRESVAKLFLRGKATLQQSAELLSILQGVLLTTKFDNKERLRQIVLEEKAGLESSLVPSGHVVVNQRLRAQFGESGWAKDQMSGIGYLFALRELVNEIDKKWKSVLKKLEAMRDALVNRNALLCNVTVDATNWNMFKPQLDFFLSALPAKEISLSSFNIQPAQTREGLTIPAQVNYVGKGANLYDLGYKYDGSAEVVVAYLGFAYLREKVRVQGGAYSVFSVFDNASGVFTYFSYRDPNVAATIENYDKAAAFMKGLDSSHLSDNELTKAIIGAIGDLDAYQLPDAKGFTSMLRYLTNRTDELRQKTRDEVLSTNGEDFIAFGEILEKAAQSNAVTVLGSQNALETANIGLEVTKVLQTITLALSPIGRGEGLNMNITLKINGIEHTIDAPPSTTLLAALRGLGFYGIKFGDEQGLSGADTVLLDGKPINAGSMLAAQAEGHDLVTIEGLGEHPEQGWKKTEGLHPLQQAFVDSGAIQCGYCTPAQILAAKALLDKNPNPSEEQVRDAIAGVLCRCTGYLKPVQAVLKAAAVLRGDEPVNWDSVNWDLGSWSDQPSNDQPSNSPSDQFSNLLTRPKVVVTSQTQTYQTVGKPEKKVDAVKLVQGKPAFTADIDMRGMLYPRVLRSPHAHARIKSIDTSKAKDLKGVAAVLTWQDIPRVVYSTAGQSDPIPGPLDAFSLDNKVRFVGDRVAFVAAETPEIAEKALSLIDVEYEMLDAILDSREAMDPDAPRIHDEPEFVNFADSNPEKNLAAEIRIDIGDVEKGFKEADEIFEAEYEVPKVQQAHIEPHVCVTYWDEDDRLVIRTSTQVPFHVRRMLAPVLDLPIKRIRVIKPRIGGGFGGKQEVLMEDVPAHLTIATKRPVIYEYTREEEFTGARSRHPMKIKMKTGVKRDGTITANSMYALSDTGAYGCHALTVTGNTGHKAMALYVGDGEYRKSPNIRFYADVVYTNTPPAGAFRGYGVPQGYWPVERHMEKIARALHLDPIEFRLKNAIRPGEYHPFSTAWNEGREPRPEIVHTVGLEQCVAQGKAAIGWDDKYGNEEWRNSVPNVARQKSSVTLDVRHLTKKKGIGVAMVMQGTAIPYLDMGGASIKMNDDGSFNLLVGATDLGTGSDTVLAQMAAEVLGVPLEDMICYSSDTDFTPFDKGAYASSTTYISGTAAVRAAEIVAERIRIRAAMMLKLDGHADIKLRNRQAIAADGRTVSFTEIALNSLHKENQEQIMGVASYVSPVSPPPFAAQFAEITVDVETGAVTVDKLVMAVDSGVIVNPLTASGQIEGGMTQALGYAVCEEMRYDDKGDAIERDLDRYHIFRADEMPELETIFVETFEPSHPFGVKAVAEIPMDGVAPAVGNAILDAIGVNVDENPTTPERVWRAIKNK